MRPLFVRSLFKPPTLKFSFLCFVSEREGDKVAQDLFLNQSIVLLDKSCGDTGDEEEGDDEEEEDDDDDDKDRCDKARAVIKG